MPDGRTEENQRRFRLANEEIERARVELGFTGEAVPFLCECPDVRCVEIVRLTPTEYARVREGEDWYFLLPDHVPEGEHVLERQDGYVITVKEAAA